MSKMIQLIRASAMPSHTMQTAARGALAVPAGEMIEILVHLALHNKVFGQTAKMTLAGWDEAACRDVAGSNQTPKEVLDYWLDPANLRPALLPALLENTSTSQAALAQLAESANPDTIEIFQKSARASQSPTIKSALAANPHLQAKHAAAVTAPVIEPAPKPVARSETPARAQPADGTASGSGEDENDHPVSDETVHAFMNEHAAEISATPEKPFQAVIGLDEGAATMTAQSQPSPASSEPAAVVSATQPAAAAAAPARAPVHHATKHVAPANQRRESTVQKINRLDIKGRIQLALKGNKEERSLLIRDGTKIVALAVLDSPKITDAEVEKFATQKNVLEAVLRTIPLKRQFAKQYTIIRNLVCNPRTPMDVSLGLMKHLLINDLKNLSSNKEVAETIRKLALRMFKQKSEDSKAKQ
jgi:hypothetical protein